MMHLRKNIFPLVFMLTGFLLVNNDVHAQGSQYDTKSWRFSNPRPFGFTVLDVDYIDNNNVIAVGSDGGIAKSTDGGSTWTYGAFTFDNPAGIKVKSSFSDLHAVNNQVVYAVGNGGMMAKTIDGGNNWSLVKTPLYNKSRNINTVWFTNATTGYIGGQYNTPDSLPKLYVTKDGGTTWDSIAAPVGGLSRIGYVNNPYLAPELVNVTAKDKEILRIKFINDSVGYVSGTGLSTYLPIRNVNSTTGVPLTTNTSSAAHHASLLWKITSGRLTDFSTSKERLGYGGVTISPVTVSSRYGQPSLSATTQSYRAMHIESDSTVIIMSFNNNIVIRVRTGKNDSTANVAVPGLFEKGKYEVLNYPFPPLSAPPIPNPQKLLVSNPYNIVKAANGKLFASGNFGLMATSVDGGNNWVMESCLPQGRNFSSFGTWAMDIAPNGKFLVMGTNGVMADSATGRTWATKYNTTPASAAYSEIEFADCNTGIATGSSSITVTRDGGKTWIDKARLDFANLYISITGLAFPSPTKAYFTTNAGTLYKSTDTATTLDPIYNNANFQFNDVVTVGNDSIWVAGNSAFSVPAANRTSSVFRSFDNGATWQVIGGFPTGSTYPILSKIAFPNRTVGYLAGSRGAVWKTTNAGTTWVDISPFPSINTTMSYTEVFALDANTVFLCGNGFPRKVVYKSTDGGMNWTDISGNIAALGTGNLTGILMHDANNGYLVSPGGVLIVTNDGGTTWRTDIAPTGALFEHAAFSPKTVPAGTPMERRRLFVGGASIGGGAPMMEYGDTTKLNPTFTETVTGASCTSPNSGSITVTASGGLAPYTYSIDGVNFQTSNVFTGLTRGPKTVTVREVACGNSFSKTVTIPFADNLTLTASNDTTVCSGATFSLFAATNGAGATFAWTPATGLSTPASATTSASITSATTYTVTATLNGCTRNEPVVIGIRPNPPVNAGPDVTIVAGEDVVLNGSSTANVRSITWTPTTGMTGPNQFNPTVKPAQTTTYTLTAVDNTTGCTGSDNVTVTVIPYCMKVMNAFTPNGDGINDRWIVTTADVCASNVNVSVFNRYGQLVYNNKNYVNNWDGTANGKPIPDGTYYYMIKFTLISGKVGELKGDVTILR
jgi:gliding motility-associated-like protein